ncbi:MAG: hypothetical protein H8J66_01555 [Nitrospira sp.]|nr:hypothetical protein [Nitrospira sp.]
MAQFQVLTHSDAQTIGWEFAQRTPDNQLDAWQRLFYQLEQAFASPDDQYAQRLAAINETLFLVRRLPCEYLVLTVPVMPDEAVRLFGNGIQLGFDNLVRLQTLLWDVADRLGDHPATMPLYAVWEALDSRNHQLIQDMHVGKEGEEGGVW